MEGFDKDGVTQHRPRPLQQMDALIVNTGARKRKRMLESNDEVISCTACRQRKTKCDRQFPCNACSLRGKASDCVPDIRKPNPPGLRELAAIVERLQVQQNRILDFLQHETRFGACNANGVHGRRMRQDDFNDAVREIQPLIETVQNRSASVLDTTDDTEIASFLQGTSSTKDLDILAETAGIGVPSQTLPDPSAASLLSNPPYFANVQTGLFQSIVKARPSTLLWQQSAINDIVKVLPANNDLQSFVGLYFKFIGWQVHAILQKQIDAELEELEALRSADRLAQVDPAWFAMLFMVMAFGVLTAYENQGSFLTVHRDILWTSAKGIAQGGGEEQAMANLFLQYSQAALAVCDWAIIPSIRVVQTLCLHGWWIQHMDPESGLFEAGTSSQRMRASVALSHCRAFGLHQLSDSPDRMPLDDSGFPVVACGLKRQMALRIWHSYKWLECLNGYITDDVINSNSVDPALCSDSDLGRSKQISTTTSNLDPACIGLFFCLKTAQFRMEYLKVIQKGPVSDATAKRLEAMTRHEMSDLRGHIESMPHVHVPPPMRSAYGFAFTTRVIESASILRIRRSALRRFANPFAADAEPVYSSTMTAAADLMRLLVDPAGQHLSVALPASMLYFLNAAIPLAIEIRRDTMEASTTHTELLSSAIDVLHQQRLSCRNRPVAANAHNALQALRRLCKRLNTPTTSDLSSCRNYHLISLQTKLDVLLSSPPPPTHTSLVGDMESGVFTLFASGTGQMLLGPAAEASLPFEAMNIGSGFWDSMLLDQSDLTNWLDQL